LKPLSPYFITNIFTGINFEKAPFLKDSKYLPFDTVPSQNIAIGGNFKPFCTLIALLSIAFKEFYLSSSLSRLTKIHLPIFDYIPKTGALPTEPLPTKLGQ